MERKLFCTSYFTTISERDLPNYGDRIIQLEFLRYNLYNEGVYLCEVKQEEDTK